MIWLIRLRKTITLKDSKSSWSWISEQFEGVPDSELTFRLNQASLRDGIGIIVICRKRRILVCVMWWCVMGELQSFNLNCDLLHRQQGQEFGLERPSTREWFGGLSFGKCNWFQLREKGPDYCHWWRENNNGTDVQSFREIRHCNWWRDASKTSNRFHQRGKVFR